MQLTDTHAHLYLPEFKDDLDLILTKASNLGVQRIYLPNIDSTTIDSLGRVCMDYPDTCFPMMGLHPCSVKEDFEKELELVKV